MLFGEQILIKGDDPIGVMFLSLNGATVLGINDSVRILDLYEQSFFGEWEVIFEKPSERSYIAINDRNDPTVSTQFYFIKPEYFHLMMEDFKDLNTLIKTRAIRRRAYFRFIEQEV